MKVGFWRICWNPWCLKGVLEMMERFDGSRNRWILVDFGANVSPNVYPRLPQNVKWGNKWRFWGKHMGKQIARSIVNKDNTEDLNKRL